MVILLVLVAFPSLLLIVQSSIRDRNEAIEEAQKSCLQLVNTIAAEEQAVVAGVQQSPNLRQSRRYEIVNRSKRLKTLSHLKVAPIQIFSVGRVFDLPLPVSQCIP